MIDLSTITDRYAREARAAPALISALPAGLGIMLMAPEASTLMKAALAAAASCGFTLLLAHIARDAGKALEAELFASMGGKPSMAMLRHRDTRLNAATKARYHQKLRDLALQMPNPIEEQRDPVGADIQYLAASELLLVRTRSTRDFPLLFQENINYGLRRNMLGLRPLSVALALLSMIASVVVLAIRPGLDTAPLLSCGFSALLLVWQVGFVTPAWVQARSEDYARRLLETLEVIAP